MKDLMSTVMKVPGKESEKVDPETLQTVVDCIKRMSVGITESLSVEQVEKQSRDLAINLLSVMMKSPDGIDKVKDTLFNSRP